MDGLGEVANTGRGNSSHGDSSVGGHVNVPLLLQLVDLVSSQTAVAEHSDLVGDVRPVASRSLLLQVFDQQLSHLDNTISHHLNFLAP